MPRTNVPSHARRKPPTALRVRKMYRATAYATNESQDFLSRWDAEEWLNARPGSIREVRTQNAR